jgi:hypothetical protein
MVTLELTFDEAALVLASLSESIDKGFIAPSEFAISSSIGKKIVKQAEECEVCGTMTAIKHCSLGQERTYCSDACNIEALIGAC